MAFNLEKLTVKDTFTNWRDKINAIVDVAVLAPMADEDGIMRIDVLNCNTKEVQFGSPVRMLSDVDVKQIDNTGSYTSSTHTETIAGTTEAALKMTATEDYLPWASGRTANGTMSMWTSMFDDDIHFSYVNLAGEVVNTFTWDPSTNIISATVGLSDEARTAWVAETLQTENLSASTTPGSYPVLFGSVNGDAASASWDEAITYSPRTDTLTVPTVKGSLDGNAKTASSAAKWTSKRRVTLTNDAEGYADFDGSANFNLPCSLVSTGVVAGQYGPASNVVVPRTNRNFTVPSFRVDEKGRITEAFTRSVTFPFPEVDVDSSFSANSVNPVQNKVLQAKFASIDSILANTPDKSVATTTSDGLLSAADKAKLNGLQQWPRLKAITATTKNAAGTTTGSASKNLSESAATSLTITAQGGLSAAITQGGTSAAPTIDVALSVSPVDVAGAGLSSLNGKIVAPTYVGCTSTKAGTAGIVPAAAANQMNQFLNGAGQWASPIGTTYANATTSTAGLMSAADKSKLDGVQAQASKVSVTRSLSSGVKIATLNINGTNTDLFCEKNTDTTYVAFSGATSSAAGTAGLVPAPAKGAQAKYLRGDSTWQAVYDSSQIDTKLNSKANLASPTLTGTPKAPTAAAGTNTDQLATTAFVSTAVGNVVAGAPTGLDTLKEIATSIGNNTNFKKYVDDADATKLSTTSANYVKALSISGTTLKVTKGDGSVANLTTQDTNTTYVVFGKSGANASTGLVPKPATTAGTTKYLREDGTWQVPPDTNTKVTNTLGTTTKAYITGTTSASTNTGTQIFDTGVFLTTAAGTLQATKFVGALQGNADSATKLATARTINGVSFNGTANITVADSTKVAKAGDTMTGNLVIKRAATASVTLQNTNITKGSKPSATQYANIAITSSAGNATANRLGLLETSITTAGNVKTSIHAYKNTKDATTNAALSVTVEQGGTSYANCPTPAAGDNSTKIATTAWVNGKFHFSTSAPSNSTGANGDLWYQYV